MWLVRLLAHSQGVSAGTVPGILTEEQWVTLVVATAVYWEQRGRADGRLRQVGLVRDGRLGSC